MFPAKQIIKKNCKILCVNNKTDNSAKTYTGWV